MPSQLMFARRTVLMGPASCGWEMIAVDEIALSKSKIMRMDGIYKSTKYSNAIIVSTSVWLWFLTHIKCYYCADFYWRVN